MPNKNFKALITNIVSLSKVFTWSDRLIGVYINDVYYDRNSLSRKQLASFEYIPDFDSEVEALSKLIVR